MGCTVREKHIRPNRRAQSAKNTPTPTTTDVDHHHHHQNMINDTTLSLSKSMLESGLKPWTYNMGFDDSMRNVSNPNNPNPNTAQNPSFDDCGWGYCTEEQLEDLLLKNLEFLYNEAISKLVSLGYDEDVALKAVLRKGHCYGGMDVLTNIVHNSLSYLNGGSCGNDGSLEESELVFTDLRQLQGYSLAGMVCLLQQVHPQLSRGDAMWCLLMSDLHVGRASTIDITMLPSHSNSSGNAMIGMDNVNANAAISGVSVSPGMYKFHGGWGFGNGGNLELPANGFGGVFSYSEGSVQREIECPKRFNLNPSLKSLLKRNVAAFAAGFHAQQQMQMQSQPCTSSAVSGDSSKGTTLAADAPAELGEESYDNNQDVVNSVLNKFRELNLDENLERVAEDQKDEIILTLLHQVKDLEKQVKERKEWAHQKALQAATKLSNDLTELKLLRMEREETQRLKKGKQTLEDTTMKRLSEMENALRKASSQVDRANAAVRQLEIENAEIRAEMEAFKLSASESVTACLEVAKREKKCLKRLLAWEKQKTKLQEEIAAEKQKVADLQQQVVQIHAAQKEAEVCQYTLFACIAALFLCVCVKGIKGCECHFMAVCAVKFEVPSSAYMKQLTLSSQAKWRQEVKEKDLAVAQVEEERRAKETTEGNNKRKLEALRLRIEIDFQRRKDDLQRLEQELSRLKACAECTDPQHPYNTLSSGRPPSAKNQGETIARLLRELDEPEKETGCERECLICMKEEVSVVFLPCAHQVMCANCGEDYGKKGKAACPCCRVPIKQKVRIFGASS
ncbi:hypothetical protein Cgig2_024334 [Carnegiea gigantea]|uniref:RING-type domain-containing protein n=1 Tax=Carnegiea gigantea TaxID=171969 RepID=A0A9Q1K2S3_9CARY|nr:hypothetical protein Cgig2_024334 [Carnegiea gigantea]